LRFQSEKITTLDRPHASIIDEAINTAKLLQHGRDGFLMRFDISKIAFKKSHSSAKRTQITDDGGVALAVGDCQIKTLSRKCTGDAAPDTTASASDQRNRSLTVHASTSRLRLSATRRACAAMVSAGLTAAEVGRNDASTTWRLGWS